MGFSIGGLLKDVGINLPKIDLGSIGKSVLDEGKKLLGEVVQDSFTLSNQPGQTFASDMNLNILGDNIRLPNPIGSLANKLLGAADGELNKFGVNVDFKKVLGELFHLPTEQGNVAVPSLKNRLASGQVGSGAQATGGAAALPAGATTRSGNVATPGANAVGGAGSADTSAMGSADPSSSLDMNGIYSKLSGLEGKMNQDLSDLANLDPNSKDYQAKLFQLQTEIQNIQRIFDTISNLFKSMHDTKMSIIGNMR